MLFKENGLQKSEPFNHFSKSVPITGLSEASTRKICVYVVRFLRNGDQILIRK